MTSFCIDVNVWIALSDPGHSHHTDAWNWLELLPEHAELIFARVTQLGLLRLLTNRAVMGERTRTVREAWDLYYSWLNDPRVEFHPEPNGMDAAFRDATAALDSEPASKWIGDCYLLAFAHRSNATLVTFEKTLANLARKQGCRTIVPA
jgi:toxin-antitoxin system PIN domain toxin